MVRRRSPGEGKPEKEKFTFKGKKFPKGVKFDDLPDAIVDGKWNVPLKGAVAFERARSGKTDIHVGEVHTVDPVKGSVTIYDETLEQFYNVFLGTPLAGRIKQLNA